MGGGRGVRVPIALREAMKSFMKEMPFDFYPSKSSECFRQNVQRHGF